MKKLVSAILLFLITAPFTPSAAAIEYVRVSGQIQNNSIDPGPNGLTASFNGTNSSAEIRNDGSYSIIVPKSTSITFYLRTSKFYFRNNSPKIFTENSVIDLLIPSPVKFSGKVVDAQGIPITDVYASLVTSLNDQYKEMSANIEKNDNRAVWGILANTDMKYTADTAGNFTIYSYVTQESRVIDIVTLKRDSSGLLYKWRSSPFKAEMPKDFVACFPRNFGADMKLPNYCFEDEMAWRERESKQILIEKKAAAEAKAAADKASSLKKVTITCTKGKFIKKVTAVKPKCPTGYKVKK
jgi:hypothetical protein